MDIHLVAAANTQAPKGPLIQKRPDSAVCVCVCVCMCASILGCELAR